MWIKQKAKTPLQQQLTSTELPIKNCFIYENIQ